MNFSDYDAAAKAAEARAGQLKRDAPLSASQSPSEPKNRPLGIWILCILWFFFKVVGSVIGLIVIYNMKIRGIPPGASAMLRTVVMSTNGLDYVIGLSEIIVAAGAVIKLFQLKKLAYQLFLADFALAVIENLRLGATVGFGATSSRALYSELFVLFAVLYVRHLKQKAILQ